MRATVADLGDEHFARPSGCAGRLVRDLVCHLVVDARDVLITLATPAVAAPTRDAVAYWRVVEPPTGDDPLDALTVRLAAAYEQPSLLRFHLDDVGSAAGCAAALTGPTGRVGTQHQVLTVDDYLGAYVLERMLHHLDLAACVPGAARPPAEGPAAARELFEGVVGAEFPRSFPDEDVLLVGTGRRVPTDAERATLGDLAARLPFPVG